MLRLKPRPTRRLAQTTTYRALLARGDLLLGRDRALARTFARARIGVRALATHRQIPPVAQPAVALNFDQPANVHLDLLAEIAFDAALGFNGLAQLIDFFLGQVLDLLGFVHVRLGAKRPRPRLPDAVDRSEADPDTLLQRKIYSSNTCHACSLYRFGLALALLVLRVDANHAHHAAPVNHLALVANLFYRSPHFHSPLLAQNPVSTVVATCIGTRCARASDRTAKARPRPCLPPK